MTSKKKVSQEELRRLMNKHKGNSRSDAKKIDSPLAKYSADGTLTCLLCNTAVRSELVWNVHVNCKLHKNNILLAKQKQLPTTTLASNRRSEVSNKRHSEYSSEDVTPPKKIKGILKNSVSQSVTVKNNISSADLTISKTLPHQETSIQAAHIENNNKDDNMDHVDQEDMKEEQGCLNSDSKTDTLPEGFFDDPKMDAKARNVEYKDPIEEEWERFQKEIKEEVTFSSQIIEEDHEEATAERQIEEIDEQLRNWNRVLELERKKEAVKAAERVKMEVDEGLSSGEEDFDEFLDWRSKKSYK